MYILPALQSVQQQNYTNWECIVVDDGGNDNTAEVVQSLKDKRFHYYWKNNAERAAARNYGVCKANGDYITFLDSDDILYPCYLEEAINLIKQHPQAAFFHLAYEIKNNEGKIVVKHNNRKGNLNRQLITGNHLSNIGVVLTYDAAIKNPYNETYALSGSEDYELWLRLAAQYQINYCNHITAALIQHKSRSVFEINSQKLIDRINLLIRHTLENQEVNQFIGKDKRKFLIHRYAYLALHLAMSNYLKKSVKYLFKLLFINPSFIFNRKFWGILKNIIISANRKY